MMNTNAALSPEQVKQQIEADISNNTVLLYMKGTADFPQCGFSSAVVQVLKHLNVPFKSVNVLDNADIRQGIKDYSEWPTIPQLYVKGEFIGGCDIVREMFSTGELKKLFEEKGIAV